MRRRGSAVILATILLSAEPWLRSGHGTSLFSWETFQAKAAQVGIHNKNTDRDPNEGQTDHFIRAYRAKLKRDLSDYCYNKGLSRCSDDDFLIAIVPDPIHTHLALFFDRTIEALEEGLQDEDWIFDHARIPWDAKEYPESDDYRVRLGEKEYYEQLENLPGLMVFRAAPATPRAGTGSPNIQNADRDKQLTKRMFVFVVGETPTGGVHEDQFRQALKEIHCFTNEINCFTHSEKPLPRAGDGHRLANDSLRIFGPTFSGSLASLQALLRCPECAGGHGSVSIHSGSVSSGQAIADFERTKADERIHFASFQENDEVAEERFISFITDSKHGYDARCIALLSEDETAYGAFSQSGSPDTSGEVTCGSGPDADRRDVNKVLKLYFPREVSQLRAAYQRDRSAATATQSSGTRSILPLDLDNVGSDDDSVARFSRGQLPLSQESVLLGIVSELRKHHIQCVMLRATDSLDAIFLARYLRSAYSSALIVVVGADMLLGREVQDPKMIGVLVLTTYSLVSGASDQFPRTGVHLDRVFPSTNAAGAYNAVRSLLEDPIDYDLENLSSTSRVCAPAGTRQLQRCARYLLYQYSGEWGCNYDCSVPGTHLTVLGNDGFWKVTTLRSQPHVYSTLYAFSDGAHFYSPAQSTRPAKLKLPRGGGLKLSSDPVVPDLILADDFTPAAGPSNLPSAWILFGIVAVAASLGFSICLWFSSIFSDFAGFAQLAPATFDCRRIVIILFSSWVLITLLLLAEWPFHKPVIPISGIMRAFPWLLLVAMVILFGATCFDLFTRAPSNPLRLNPQLSLSFYDDSLELPNAEPARWWKHGLFLATFGATVVLIARSVGHLETSPAGAVRWLSLVSGVSPMLPIILLGSCALWWSWHTLAGCNLLDERTPKLPDRTDENEISALIATGTNSILESGPLVREIRENLKVTTGWSPWLWSVSLLVAACFLVDLRHPVVTFEGCFYEWFLASLFAIASVALIVNGAKLWSIWKSTKQLLVSLDAIPLREGFKEIHGFSWGPLWQIGAERFNEFHLLLDLVREALNTAANTAPEWFPQRAQMDSTWEAIHTDAQTARNVSRWKPWVFRRLQRELLNKFAGCQLLIADCASGAFHLIVQTWTEDHEDNPPKRRKIPPTVFKAHACQHFVCLLYVNFLLVVLIRIRHLVLAIGGMYIFLLLAVTLYPFQPRAELQTLMVVLLVYALGVVGLVLGQMHRDTTLSHITDTQPGELGADFWLRMLSFTVLPLLSFLASAIPEIGGAITSWLEPVLHSLR